MENNNKSKTCGVSVAWVLTIIFFILKMCGKITWAWVWVFSPLWITLGIAVIIIIISLILAAICMR